MSGKIEPGKLPKKVYESLRSQALHPEVWAQRIPTIAVFSGNVCVSTGSHAGQAYDPKKHPLTAEEASRYGEVHCARLRNHLMVEDPAVHGALRFEVDDSEMRIIRGEETLARNAHGLSGQSLAALKQPKRIQIGSGIYGRFKGAISNRPGVENAERP